MPKLALFDQLHLSVLVQSGVADTRCRQMRRTLNSHRFQARLHSAITGVIKQYPSLKLVKVTISR